MRGKGRARRGGGRARRRSRAIGASNVVSSSFNWVTIGAKVEVRSDEDGFVGAWFAAEVVHLELPTSCVVEYEQLLSDNDAASPLQELVLLGNVRPCPPVLPACHTWLEGHLVEAYDHDGWWAGVVVRALPDLNHVLVHFRTTGEELGFHPSLLRGLQNWENGRWINLTEAGQPDKYHACDAVDANGSLSPPRLTEMRKGSRAQQWEHFTTDSPSLEIGQATETEELDDINCAEFIPESAAKGSKSHKKFNGYELSDMEDDLQVLRSNGFTPTTGEIGSGQSESQKSKIRILAYKLLVEALRLKGPLNWDHERLLSDVRLHLNITSEEQTFVLNGFMPS